MKLRGLTPSHLLACLLLAAAIHLPLEPWLRDRPSGWRFEVRVEADEPGVVQLYYNSGSGISEADSVVQPITANRAQTMRFALPYGTVTALRFDPLDRDGRITIGLPRVVDSLGRVVAEYTPDSFFDPNQVRSMTRSGDSTVIETEPGATDAHFSIRLRSPIVVGAPPAWRDFWVAFGACAAALLCWSFASPALRRWPRAAWDAAAAAPVAALAAAALAGTLAANWPVALAGRTFVSPNMGVALLYGQSPWLPGPQSGEVRDPQKSDVAALLWQHMPMSVVEGRALRSGELPLWDRYDSAGLPLLGQGQSCFGDPLNFLPILAGGASWSWDLKILIAKWSLAFGVGLCAWRMCRHFASAVLVAVSSAFFGFFIYRINHPAIFSVCYAPWILYAWLCCEGARGWRRLVLSLAGLVGANWMEINSGTAKEAYSLLFSMNGTGLCLIAFSARSLIEKARILVGAVAAGLVFAMAASPVWYTFYRALGASYTSYNVPETFQIQPGLLVGLFDGAFYRPFQFEYGVANPSANFFIFLGVLWALVRWRSCIRDPGASALLLSCAAIGALVYGVIPPAVVNRVPFLGNILHVDNSFSCALIVLVVPLAAFGWREAWARASEPEGGREAALVLVMAIVAIGACLGTAQAVMRSAYAALSWGRNIRIEPFIGWYALGLVLGSAALLAALVRIRRSGAVTAGALFLAAAGCIALHWRETFRVGPAYSTFVVRPAHRTNLDCDSPAVDFVTAGVASSPARAVGFHNDLLPGWSGVYGIEGISGPDALMNPRYRELLDAGGIKRIWDWRYIIEPSEVASLHRILDLLNVRYYLGYHLGANRPTGGLARDLSADMEVFESRTAWPRAYWTDGVAVYSDVAQFASWVKGGDGLPFVGVQRSVWDGLRPVPRVSGDLSKRTVRGAKGYVITPNSTSFVVEAPGPGFIVLTEAFEEGNFVATVNGVRRPYVRVNHAFRGIYVDAAGTYSVRFAYEPRGIRLTMALFWIGAAAVLAAIVAALWRPKFPGAAARPPA